MNSTSATKRAIIALLVGLAALSLAACDPKNQEPVQKPQGIVQVKRAPCGANGKCQTGEVNCWQLQIRDVANSRTNFRCVEKAEWDRYKVGEKYPKASGQ